MRERLERAARWAGPPVAVGIFMGVLGPFGTFQVLDWPVRVLYWLCIVLVNWALCDLAVRRLDGWPTAPLKGSGGATGG